jgi:hypothetical protein
MGRGQAVSKVMATGSAEKGRERFLQNRAGSKIGWNLAPL